SRRCLVVQILQLEAAEAIPFWSTSLKSICLGRPSLRSSPLECLFSPFWDSVRVRKVDIDIILIAHCPPMGEFFSTIEGDGFEQISRYLMKPVINRRFNALGCSAFWLQCNDRFRQSFY